MVEREEIGKPQRDLLEIIHFTESVGAKIHGVLDEVEIYRVVKEEFARSERYTASILMLTGDGRALRIADTSVPPGVVQAGEKATGLRMRGFHIDLGKSRVYSRVVEEGETVETCGREVIGELFPRPVAALIARVMGYEDRPAILTPLRRRGVIIGVLAVSSTDLAGYFVPSVRNLAQHISTALDLADEYAERRRVQEAHLFTQFAIDRTSDGAFWMGPDARFIYVNDAACQRLGYSRDELLTMTVHDIDPGFPELVWADHWREVKERGSFTLESNHRAKDGQVFPVEITVNYIEFGGKEYNCAFARDISERKLVEEALLESEEKYRVLVENANDAIVVAQDGLLKFFNPKTSDVTGFSAEELAIKPFVELVHPDDREVVVKRHQQRLMGKSPPQVYSFRIVARDGRVKWVEIRPVVITWEGRPATLNILSEITERRQNEQSLRRRAEELAALQATVLDITTPHDLPTLLHTIVERAVRLLNTTGGGLYLYEPEHEHVRCVVSYNTPRDYSGTVLKLGEGAAGTVAQTGEPVVIDDYRTWNGRAAVYEEDQPFTAVLSVPMIWQGQVTGVIHVLGDVERRRFGQADLELLNLLGNHAAIAVENARLRRDLQHQMEQLRDAQAQLVQSAKLAAVGEMAAGVAHELNNPLTSILGFTELLLEESSPGARARKDLEKVIAEAQRARDIVQNLFDFSRQTKPERQPADVNEILRRTVSVVRYQLETAGVVVEERYDADIPSLSLDVGQMGQVFLNLITNALQSMPEGGTLGVCTARVGEEVSVSISDTGVGIPAQIWERIFDPFFSTSRVGAGMGLPVSQNVVREHGGRIVVESEEGRGSTFTVWLPVGGGPEA
jgi:PAS domain S-box-containing protein